MHATGGFLVHAPFNIDTKGALYIQVCALNGYGCVDTEYAWYQQQQQQHLSPYTSVMMADRDDHGDKTAFICPVTSADYCPGCVALYAAEADAAAASAASETVVSG